MADGASLRRWRVVLFIACAVARGDAFDGPLRLGSRSESVDPLAGTVLFANVQRREFCFDVYGAAVNEGDGSAALLLANETQLTDGVNLNYNGAFGRPGSDAELYFVSERDGNVELYACGAGGNVTRLTDDGSLQDRPILSHDGRRLFFISTHQPSQRPRQDWTALYALTLATGELTRLTPRADADLSPALSPAGKRLAAATGSGETGKSDIVIMDASDGRGRKIVARNGGWPTFAADGKSVFFHRRVSEGEDGWWAVFVVDLKTGAEERVTGPGFPELMTPAASPVGDWVALAMRYPGGHRHIGAVRRAPGGGWELAQLTRRATHHYAPFWAPNGARLGYHRCRAGGGVYPLLEHKTSPVPGLAVVQLRGQFPSFSEDGGIIAFNEGMQDVALAHLDGSNRTVIFYAPAFGTSLRRVGGRAILASAQGAGFSPAGAEIAIVTLTLPESVLDGSDGDIPDAQRATLTAPGTGNNAFPAISPDGKQVLFRSARDGNKNLYLMPLAGGEAAGLTRLTHGNWTDTMAAWSPDGKLITFASDRDSAQKQLRVPRGFDVFVMRPDGTGVSKVFDSYGGRSNHPSFSPDGTHLLFTSDHAGYSAEQITVPHEFQPYGDLFIMKLDGHGLTRLTHDPYENGTPQWGPKIAPACFAPDNRPLHCEYDDQDVQSAESVGDSTAVCGGAQWYRGGGGKGAAAGESGGASVPMAGGVLGRRQHDVGGAALV